MSAVVMPEGEWVTLCKKQCLARRKQYGNDSCDERDGMCSECVSDALDCAPKKYRVSDAVALRHDPLPGCEWSYEQALSRPAQPTEGQGGDDGR